MSIRFPLLALASPIALATATPVLAQEAPAETADEGVIVVTAQLREQSATEVPFALTAYDQDFLDRLSVQEFDSLARFVPGLQVQNQSPNNPAFSIRGITSDSGDAFEEPRVSIFQDGVSISKSRGAYVELFDLERVEIAKGPQSTLYGRGALIGAINLVQAKADPSQGYGYLLAEGGDYGQRRVDFTANIPLSDTFAVRAAARIKERDGTVENLLGGEDFNGIRTEAVRGSLRFAPGALTLDVIGNYQHDRGTGTSFKSLSFNPVDPITGAVLGDRSPYSGVGLATGNFENGRGIGLDREVWGVTGIANYELDANWSLHGTASYREFQALEVFDPDGTALPMLSAAEDARGEQTMATLRLTYSDDRLTAFVGGTYFDENASTRVPLQFDERVALARLADAQVPGVLAGFGAIPGRPVTDPAPLSVLTNRAFVGGLLQNLIAAGAGVPLSVVRAAVLPDAQAAAIADNFGPAYLESYLNDSSTRSFDLFGDVTYKLTDRLEFGAGLRYTHDDKTTGYSAAILNGRSTLAAFQFATSLPATPVAGPANDLFDWLGILATPGFANLPAASGIPQFALFSQPTPGNGGRAAQSFTDSGFTWRANLRYDLGNGSLYANYARGRRPEVLSVRSGATPGAFAVFDLIPAETVDSFEIGAKTELLGRTLFLDGAVFYNRYSNFQTQEQVGGSFVTVNAGKAETYGFETQLRWVPSDNVTLFANYAYNRSRLESGAYKGNSLRMAPDHAASGGFTASLPLGPVRLSATPSVSYVSKVFFDNNNDLQAFQANNLVPDLVQDEFQDGYALVNLRVGVETADGRWRLEGFVTNLFDEEYIKDAGNVGDSLGLPTFVRGDPRMIGASLSLRLGGQ